jgi:hypothetical protein
MQRRRKTRQTPCKARRLTLLKAGSELTPERSSTLRRVTLNLKLRGDPLQSLGTAYTAGMALKFDGPSPSGSYENGSTREQFPSYRSMDSCDKQVVLAWAIGVLSVTFAVKPPRWVRDHLDYRRRTRKYTLREYIPLRVARYLASCETTGRACLETVWCCRLKRLASCPSDEFIGLVKRVQPICELEVHRPMNNVSRSSARRAQYFDRSGAELPDRQYFQGFGGDYGPSFDADSSAPTPWAT